MGLPEKRRAVNAMVVRWNRDLERLHKLFGEYDYDDYSDGAEMQRNLGSAAAAANGFLAAKPIRDDDG